MNRKRATREPQWWETLETGDKIICIMPCGIQRDAYEIGDVAFFLRREGGGLRIENRGVEMIVSAGDWLPHTPEGIAEAELAAKIERMNSAEYEEYVN